jgi:CubicO group peptidase (beta-lactamase class C family)
MPLGTIGVRYAPQEEKPTLKERLTEDAVLTKKPGESFYYSNTGFNILELLIEDVSGQSFAEYMNKEILMPLHMENSTFQWSKDINNKIPNGYDSKGKEIPVYVYPDKASGGLFATVEDIARFVTIGMPTFKENISVLDEEYINQIYSPVVEINGYYGLIYDYYGYGHFKEELSNGNYAVAHGGQGSGWMTHFQAVPESGDGMVILSNSQRSWPFIGYVLRDWADWRNLGTLGIEMIPLATIYMWITIGIILFAFLLQGWRLIEDYYLNKRNFHPLRKRYKYIRGIELIISLMILGLLIWEMSKPYSFLASVFPLAYQWLGIILLLEAFVLLLSSLSPKKIND